MNKRQRKKQAKKTINMVYKATLASIREIAMFNSRLNYDENKTFPKGVEVTIK